MYFKTSNLLPAGCIDILPEKGFQRFTAINQIVHYFEKNGYRYIIPPMIEFDHSHQQETRDNLNGNAFRMLDPNSSQIIALRSDMTKQVARIATSRLQSAPSPLRLCYGGDVLRIHGEGRYRERQLTQAGIELIGSNAIASDIEVIRTALNALKKTKMQHLSIDFSIPRLTDHIMENMTLDDAARQNLLDALEHKDEGRIQQYGADKASILIELCRISKADSKSFTHLLSLELPTKAKQLVENLQIIIEVIREEFQELQITLDLVEYLGFHYHEGVCYAIFSKESISELARGGRYCFLDHADNLHHAVGCSLYVNNIMRVLEENTTDIIAKRLYIPYGITPEQQQVESCILIHGLEPETEIMQEAKRMQCHAVWLEGKIQDIN